MWATPTFVYSTFVRLACQGGFIFPRYNRDAALSTPFSTALNGKCSVVNSCKYCTKVAQIGEVIAEFITHSFILLHVDSNSSIVYWAAGQQRTTNPIGSPCVCCPLCCVHAQDFQCARIWIHLWLQVATFTRSTNKEVDLFANDS